jgi:hypothetical protein
MVASHVHEQLPVIIAIDSVIKLCAYIAVGKVTKSLVVTDIELSDCAQVAIG